MNVQEANIMVLDFISTHCKLVDKHSFGDPNGTDLYLIGLFRKLLVEARP